MFYHSSYGFLNSFHMTLSYSSVKIPRFVVGSKKNCMLGVSGSVVVRKVVKCEKFSESELQGYHGNLQNHS